MRRFRKMTFSTAQKVRQIKRDNPRIGYKEIISQLGLEVTPGTIYNIIANRTYKERLEVHHNPKRKLTCQDVKSIKGMLKLGYKCEYLAIRFKVTSITIARIKYGITWRNVA
jgi:hypothetical protein